MTYIPLVKDPRWPLEFLQVTWDDRNFSQLCEVVGEGRKRRFNQVVVSGGVALKGAFGQQIHMVKPFQSSTKRQASRGMILGYYSPRKGEIKLFPEAILERVWVKKQFRIPDLNSHQREELLQKIRHEFYQMLIEELEHGYQNPSNKPYRSVLGRIVAATSPVMMLFIVASVFYIEFNQLSYWWLSVVVAVFVSWMFLPVWVSFIPVPKWWSRLRYRFNQREKDAKGKAVSMKLIRLAREAIKIEWSTLSR